MCWTTDGSQRSGCQLRDTFSPKKFSLMVGVGGCVEGRSGEVHDYPRNTGQSASHIGSLRDRTFYNLATLQPRGSSSLTVKTVASAERIQVRSQQDCSFGKYKKINSQNAMKPLKFRQLLHIGNFCKCPAYFMFFFLQKTCRMIKYFGPQQSQKIAFL